MSTIDARLVELLKKGQDIVELGCGSGYVLDDIASQSNTAIGIDVSRVHLNRRSTPPENWQFVESDLNNEFPLPDESVDAILANQVIEHIYDPIKFSSESFRILRPGGISVVTTPNIRYAKYIWRLVVRGEGPATANCNTLDGAWDDGHIHYFTHRDLQALYKDAGFSNVMSQGLIDTHKRTKLRLALDRLSGARLVREFLSGNILLVAKKN